MARRLNRSRRAATLGVGVLGFLVVLGGLMAAGLPLAQAGAAATAALMALWWITEPLPLWTTALLPLVCFPVLGAAPLGDVVLQYVDPVNFLFLGGMWIAATMEVWGLHRRIALGVVARIGASPRRIVLGFMITTGFVSMWISNTAAAIMMFPIGMAVVQKLAEQVGEDRAEIRAFGMALMLGIAYAASLGGIGSKIGTGTNLVFVKQYHGMFGSDVAFTAWFKIGLPVMLVAIPAAWLYLVRVAARLPRAAFPGSEEPILTARRELGPMGRGEVVALIAFLLAAVLWTFRQTMDFGVFVIPGWTEYWPWTWSEVLGFPVASLPRPWSELLGPRGAESVIAMLIGGALLIIPVERRPLKMALPVTAASRISWGLLVLLGGGFAMAQGIASSGLSDRLAAALQGLSLPSPFLVLVVVCLATTALSEVASNTATASILLPLLGASAGVLGLHPAVVMFAATLAASFGFMLPAGTPPNAVVFSSGYISVKQMARSGLVVDLGGCLIIAILCYFLAPWALGVAN